MTCLTYKRLSGHIRAYFRPSACFFPFFGKNNFVRRSQESCLYSKVTTRATWLWNRSWNGNNKTSIVEPMWNQGWIMLSFHDRIRRRDTKELGFSKDTFRDFGGRRMRRENEAEMTLFLWTSFLAMNAYFRLELCALQSSQKTPTLKCTSSFCFPEEIFDWQPWGSFVTCLF